MITLCVLLTAHPDHERQLTDYENRVLALLDEHNAAVIARVALDEGEYTEAQILEFQSERDLERFQSDPRRLALAEVRDTAIASTRVLRGSRLA